MATPNIFEHPGVLEDQPSPGDGQRVVVKVIVPSLPGKAGPYTVHESEYVGTYRQGLKALAGRFTATELHLLIEAAKYSRDPNRTDCWLTALTEAMSRRLGKTVDAIELALDVLIEKKERLTQLQDSALDILVELILRTGQTHETLDDTASLAKKCGLELAPTV